MPEARIHFHEALANIEADLQEQGRAADRQLAKVLDALGERDAVTAQEVIYADDPIDDTYVSVETGLLDLLARQAPVASDLRLISALLHCNMHLERMADLCVNIAKFVQERQPYPSDSPMVERLNEMGRRASDMLMTAMAALRERSVDLAEALQRKDDAIDRLNRGMLDELKQHVDDDESFEWATKLVLVARYLERFGDHCVDIGEQVAFLVTGVFREFTDASHAAR